MKEEQKRRLNRLEPDYRRYTDPDVMLALKAAVLDDVWDIHSGVMRPEGAQFVVGRTFQALAPYREALRVISEYEGAEKYLADRELSRDVSVID